MRKVPDFPRKGLLFRDISPLLRDPTLLRDVCTALSFLCTPHITDVDYVCGMEARGFIFGPTVSLQLDKGFVMLRKANKLPGAKKSLDYGLEYGKDVLEMHTFPETDNCRFVVVDDLLATGGTALAAARLVAQSGGTVVAYAFVIELADCKGRERIEAWHKEQGFDAPHFYSLLIC